jgi:acyl-CoA thioesterase FadM
MRVGKLLLAALLRSPYHPEHQSCMERTHMADEGFEFPVDRTQVMLFARSLLDIRLSFRTRTTGHKGRWRHRHAAHVRAGERALAAELPAGPDTAAQGRAAARPEGGGGGGGLGRGLHAEQHYEYHHPVHVGDTLTVTTKPGKRWRRKGAAEAS